MKGMGTRIAEFTFEAPLACFEEEESSTIRSMNIFSEHLLDVGLEKSLVGKTSISLVAEDICNIKQDGSFSPFSGSLEDLVNTFDEKITTCFRDYATNVESLAPVQVRTQEEIMNECQMWWTITGTFGNILPIDWSKSYARKMHVPVLNLNNTPVYCRSWLDDLSNEDEAVATDLDMHALILSSRSDNHNVEEAVKTADEVLKEIDNIMEENSLIAVSFNSESLSQMNDAIERCKNVLSSPLRDKLLQQYSSTKLSELLNEIDSLIAALSETLVNELALRDELEYEKELKNQFISLLLAVQNRRRQHHVSRKRNQMQNGISLMQQRSQEKYLTTIIPYNKDNGLLDNEALQILIKILKAINEDNPTVPSLLTDYILKVLCPT